MSKSKSKKKVVMIGGAGRSGSTLLDLILGNTPHTYSCGEIVRLFRPYKKTHINFEKNWSHNIDYEFWHRIKDNGEQNVYDNMFGQLPKEITHIIDSSKSIYWIQNQLKYNQNQQNFDTKHLLIYKQPLDFAFSRWKRGNMKKWQITWLMYYLSYFSQNLPFRSVELKKILSTPDSYLPHVCQFIGSTYLPKQERYWEKKHNIIFGSRTAIKFLEKPELGEITPPVISEKRKFFNAEIIPNIKLDPRIELVVKTLEAFDVIHQTEIDNSLAVFQKYWPLVQVRKSIYNLQRLKLALSLD